MSAPTLHTESRHPRRRIRLGLILVTCALATAGAIQSGLLLAQHDGGWNTSVNGQTFLNTLCGEDETGSDTCAEVIDSHWGAFDLYLNGQRLVFPTSFLGLSYFIAAGIWFAVLYPTTSASLWIRRTSAIALAVGLAVTVCLMVIMRTVLDAWCGQCALIHALNTAMILSAFVLLFMDAQSPEANARIAADSREQGPTWRYCNGLAGRAAFAWTTIALIAFTIGGTFAYFHAMTEARRQWRKARGFADVIAAFQRDEAFLLREYDAQPLVPADAEANTSRKASYGNEQDQQVDALSGITIFADHANAGRACFHKRWYREYARYFPADMPVTICSLPADATTAWLDRTLPVSEARPPSLVLAAVRLLAEPVSIHAVHKRLLKLDNPANEVDYNRIADAIKIPRTSLMAAADSAEAAELVVDDISLALSAGITHAPAVILDGRHVPPICLQSPLFWKTVAERRAEQRGGIHHTSRETAGESNDCRQSKTCSNCVPTTLEPTGSESLSMVDSSNKEPTR